MELHGLPWACKWTVAVGMQQLGGSYGQYYCGQWPTGVWSGVKGDKCLMGFLVVSLVELFHRFKSYGIYSCVVGWMVPQVQVLWDFKLYRWLNCSTSSSLMGFHALSVVESFHRFKSYGISSCIVRWMVSNVPEDRSVFIFKCQFVNAKSLWLELPNHRQRLTTHKTCLLSHTTARASNSHSLLYILIGLHLPLPAPRHSNRQQLHRCRVSLCDGNPVMLAGKIWYVLAKQPHKFLRTHSTFVSLLFARVVETL